MFNINDFEKRPNRQDNNKKNTVIFFTIADVIELTGYSKRTVELMFNDPEFPACDYGKSKLVEYNALLKYFSTPRRKEASKYWRNLA